MATDKIALTIAEQISQLEERGMDVPDKQEATHFLSNISYYRLKGYWWDMQTDKKEHQFYDGSSFTEVMQRYNFDRHLRLILYDAIERIEIGVRTRLIYYPALTYGNDWILNDDLFDDVDYHHQNINRIWEEVDASREVFIVDHRTRYGEDDMPDVWKTLEVVSFGTLSKLYKNMEHQLPEKAKIATSLGLENHSQLSSWLEEITTVRNIAAHHSRLWNRKLVKSPKWLTNSKGRPWLRAEPEYDKRMRLYYILSAMLYLLNVISPGHSVKEKLLELFEKHPKYYLTKMGFIENWQNEPLWQA